MAIAILADQRSLARLIVPKALVPQTAQVIQARIGGLVNRMVKQIPFSRRNPTSDEIVDLYSTLHRELLEKRGTVLCTPEQILSSKLSGWQRLWDGKLNEAKPMVELQKWLTETCRDVLDESDFTLAVKTQLIYPSGSPIHVDGHPNRWKVAQSVLALIEDHLPALQRMFPDSIEVFRHSNGFPFIHFLKPDVEDELHRLLANCASHGKIPLLRLLNSSSITDRHLIQRVLTEEVVSWNEIKRAFGVLADRNMGPKCLLILRGLLVKKILLACIKKRWNVQYGLHPERAPVAVPFEAKGIPSQRAEFGHADVAIVLTCLAFYYGGIQKPQFQKDLEHVLMADDPAAEYDRWIHSCSTLPEQLRYWNLINIDDSSQVEELWRHLRLEKTVLDHYMNHFVFPAHAKQFKTKLQASGWDLPLLCMPNIDGQISARTTGFSGTNDNRIHLPMTIHQDDLQGLVQTNAEVLTYLLQERNMRCELAFEQNRHMKELELLKRVCKLGIRILIDAGAHILEMDNRTLARQWLEIDSQAKAAVYFGEKNQARVMYRAGKEASLFATPFVENFEECLVYLDEAHTRGVDLKLPLNARGALTLALGQTKDHTVQGMFIIILQMVISNIYRKICFNIIVSAEDVFVISG